MLQKINLLTVLTPIFLFFAPVQGLLILMFFLVFVDTATGLWKCSRLNIKITSLGLSALVSKLFVYCFSILLVFGIDKLIINEILLQFFSVEFIITKVISLVFCSIELLSVEENFKAVKGYGFADKAKSLIGFIKRVKKEVGDIKEK